MSIEPGAPEAAVDDHEALQCGPSAPLVTVIVRSIGRETLAQALDSIAGQTYPNIEVVVVDALGRDHPPLGDRCGRFPLRVVGTGQPLPRSRAANAGLDAARGEYIGFLDDDDWFLPEHVEVLCTTLGERAGAPGAYAGVDGVAGAGEVVSRLSTPYSYPRLCAGNFIPINAALFARSAIDAGCRFDETLDAYEDWDFWLQLGRRGEFANIDRTTTCYRSGGGSGVGLAADPHVQHASRETIWGKWTSLWTDGEVRAVLDWLGGELCKRDALIAELRAELRDVEGRLAAALSSLGWRLTEPMRSLASLLR